MNVGTLAGYQYQAAINGATIQKAGGGFSVAMGTVVTLTGWYDGDKYYISEHPGYYIQLSYWKLYKRPQAVSEAKAEDLIYKLIQNNKYIFENNLLLSRYANKLSYNEKVQLYNLQKRLENRDNMLREADVFTQMQESRIMGYSNYQNYLNNFMSSFYLSQSVGLVISTTTAIITGVVVLASLATAAYFAFKDAYEESVKDVELSRKMLQIFEKYQMTEEDIATIQQETQGIVTKAVLLQKIKTTFGNYKNLLIGAAVVYLGFTLYNKYKN